MIPTECKMPSLYPELERLQPRLLILAGFIGNGTLSQKAGMIRRNIVRLMDKAIFEYSSARQALLDQVAESHRSNTELLKGRIIYMFGFIDHMENCLNATRRILESLQWLRSDTTAPAQDRLQRHLIDAHAGTLIDIRDLLEHMGESIMKNKLGELEPVALDLGEDQASIRIGNYSLAFSALASIIRAFHAEAIRLLEVPHERKFS